MALTRWHLIRDISVSQSTGTLTAQLGRNYLHWCVESGNLICVVSSLPEHSFTELILKQSDLPQEDVLRAQACIDESKPFGSVLVEKRLVSIDKLRELLFQHYGLLSYFLFWSGTHVFWSSTPMRMKDDLVRVDLPFADVLLSAERSSIEVSGAIRVVHELPVPCRLVNWEKLDGRLNQRELRVVQYIKARCSINEMFRDAELDRMVCYRTLFLLWLSGYLQEPNRPRTSPAPKSHKHLHSWIRNFPADWIFPLIAGVIAGVLLSPSESPPPPSATTSQIESWKETQTPAWEDKKSQVNHRDTEAQRK